MKRKRKKKLDTTTDRGSKTCVKHNMPYASIAGFRTNPGWSHPELIFYDPAAITLWACERCIAEHKQNKNKTEQLTRV